MINRTFFEDITVNGCNAYGRFCFLVRTFHNTYEYILEPYHIWFWNVRLHLDMQLGGREQQKCAVKLPFTPPALTPPPLSCNRKRIGVFTCCGHDASLWTRCKIYPICSSTQANREVPPQHKHGYAYSICCPTKKTHFNEASYICTVDIKGLHLRFGVWKCFNSSWNTCFSKNDFI